MTWILRSIPSLQTCFDIYNGLSGSRIFDHVRHDCSITGCIQKSLVSIVRVNFTPFLILLMVILELFELHSTWIWTWMLVGSIIAFHIRSICSHWLSISPSAFTSDRLSYVWVKTIHIRSLIRRSQVLSLLFYLIHAWNAWNCWSRGSCAFTMTWNHVVVVDLIKIALSIMLWSISCSSSLTFGFLVVCHHLISSRLEEIIVWIFKVIDSILITSYSLVLINILRMKLVYGSIHSHQLS